ncbi:dephospho-CoA kinase [Companilactobacillus bobalius]|uniref:Dephospho-CoA kinase n=2 Tax=Companilactobacillus bobalius TaxID=2801451 RepID=A0A202F6Q2_9LACO|nr:dephospho-CoA kinase [Companilactobacillus bobalius]KAE9558465.1 dephospho-CoA kinase [Companilactobacillus bobalius]KRK83740.1 dephospho-CoA kinase [Companilactobacillus bobalius DSM 19674]OVE96162.1 Dephospho-CoA kinase [Companilactobacillus bobalius]
MSKIYGLTGGIASGKSTVLNLFRHNKFIVYDADYVARDVVKVGTVGLKQITQQFGEQILLPDGNLNRRKLSSIVFGDRDELDKLDKITRPLIKKEILQTVAEVKRSTDKTISIFEIPLLFEGNYQNYFDGVISVYVEPQIQLHRLMRRNALSKEVALEQINSQMSMYEKKERADFVIDNSEDLAHLQDEFSRLIPQL